MMLPLSFISLPPPLSCKSHPFDSSKMKYTEIKDDRAAIFVVELLLNFAADFFVPFFKSAWNIFDTVVVIGSIVSSAQPGGDVNLGALRIVRVLRAVRLLNRAGSLKQIVQAMFASVVPVANSFVLLALVSHATILFEQSLYF
jgi:voltage-gated sodium channel